MKDIERKRDERHRDKWSERHRETSGVKDIERQVE